MLVSDLRRILNSSHAEMYEDNEVVVAVKRLSTTIGPKPSAKVKHAGFGIDWEKGQFIITTEEGVQELGPTFKADKERAYENSEALAYIWMAISNKSLTPEQKLSNIKSILKTRGWSDVSF